jgi:hypothetical protein
MKDRFLKRPLSWSQLSAFEYSKSDWYDKYILGIETPPNPEMVFGKKLAKSIEDGKPLAPVTLLPKCEHKFEFFWEGIKCIGFADGFDPKTKRNLIEYKSGVKSWDYKRVRDHGQIDFYLLGNYQTDKVKPEEVECFLEWIPTKRVHTKSSGLSKGDYKIEFATDPPTVHRFPTSRSFVDILKFGQRIVKTVEEMEAYLSTRTVDLKRAVK